MSALLSACQQALPGFTWEASYGCDVTGHDGNRVSIKITTESRTREPYTCWLSVKLCRFSNPTTCRIDADSLSDLANEVRERMSTLANELRDACGYPTPTHAPRSF